MKILSVKIGAPSDDYSAWIRKIKMTKIMLSLGHDVDFVIYTHNGECNEEILKDIPFKYEVVKVSLLNYYLKYLKRLRDQNYDIVFCNGQFTHASLFFTKFTHSQFVLDKHGDIIKEFLLLEDGFKYDIKFIIWFLRLKFIDFLNLHFADKITCVSFKMIEDLYKRGLKRGKATPEGAIGTQGSQSNIQAVRKVSIHTAPAYG